jgi:hypothetical protein
VFLLFVYHMFTLHYAYNVLFCIVHIGACWKEHSKCHEVCPFFVLFLVSCLNLKSWTIVLCVFLFVCIWFLFLLPFTLFFVFGVLSCRFWVYYCHLGDGSLLFFFVFFSYRSLEGEKSVCFFVSYVASLIFCCCKGDVKLEGGKKNFFCFLCCMLFFVRLGLFPLYFFVYFFNFSCFIILFIIYFSIWSFVQLKKIILCVFEFLKIF